MSRTVAAIRYADCPASSTTVTSVTFIVEVRISAAYTATVATITASSTPTSSERRRNRRAPAASRSPR